MKTSPSLIVAIQKKMGEDGYKKHFLGPKFTTRAHRLAWELQSRLKKNESRPAGQEAVAYIARYSLLNLDMRYTWDVAQAHCENLMKFKKNL